MRQEICFKLARLLFLYTRRAYRSQPATQNEAYPGLFFLLHCFRFVISTSARLELNWATAHGNCPYPPHFPWCHRIDLTGQPARYLLEHGLKMDGRPDPEKAVPEGGDAGSFETFFTETGNGKFVPRSIFVDLDPSVCVDTWLSSRSGFF